MKRILITGTNSYIGTNVEEYLKANGEYIIDSVDMLGDWQSTDFSKYDVVFHVAGIAHDVNGKKSGDLYMKVNYSLAVEVAKTAKLAGVKQFIFMSSILIFNGLKGSVINKNSVPKTKSIYAESKRLADEEIRGLGCDSFIVSAMRPPMIFGKNCKGNFVRLHGLAKKLAIFPNYKNERSMCYIENFCMAIKQVVDFELGGIFYPQNKEYFCTTNIVEEIRSVYGKKTRLTKIFNFLIKPFSKISNTVNKVFGSYIIDKELSSDFDNLAFISNKESIIKSVGE